MSRARSRLLSPPVLFLAACLTPPQLFCDAIASVTVRTDTSGLPGGSSCLLTSSGAEIQCASGETNVPDLMRAAGSASSGWARFPSSLARTAQAPFSREPMPAPGFFDPAGNAIPFTVAPEPAGWPVAGLCLGVVVAGAEKNKMRRCLRRLFRLDRSAGARGLCSRRNCPGELRSRSACS